MTNPVIDAFQRAADDHDRGASEIERILLRELIPVRDQWSFDQVRDCAEQLAQAQPAMANLRSLALRVREMGESAFAEFLAERYQLLDRLPELLAKHCWPLIEGRNRVLTISRSSGVTAVLESAWQRGWRGEVVVFDGSVAGGGREQARLLAERGWNVVSQPDATVTRWLDAVTAEVAVVVGADAISELRVVNACGTGMLLELAISRNVPCVVVADSAKDLPDSHLDDMVASIERFEDLDNRRGWPVFEVFPVHFVTWRVDECGCRKPPRADGQTLW